MVDLALNHPPAKAKGESFSFSLVLFQHAGEYHRLYKAMVGKQGGTIFFNHLESYLAGQIEAQLKEIKPKMQNSLVSPEVVVQYLVSSFLSLLTWWLDRDRPYSPEQMNTIYKELVYPGLTKFFSFE